MKNAAQVAATTGALAWNVSVSDVQTALDALANAPGLTVSAGSGDDLVLTYNALGAIATDAVVVVDSTDALVAATRTTPGSAADAMLNAAITGMSERFDQATNDHFASESVVLSVDGEGISRVYLPSRFTAVTKVETLDYAGNYTEQLAAVYRLHPSLDSTGSKRTDNDFDYLQIIPLRYLAQVLNGGKGWPYGPATVRVTGTAGWTVTPRDVKRAVALMVYTHLQPERADLRQITSLTTNTERVEYAQDGLGLPEVDAIVAEYRRPSGPGA